MRFLLWIACLWCVFFNPALAASTIQPVAVDKAFALSASLFGNDTVVLHWDIMPKHHLYRDRFSWQVLAPTNASMGAVLYPPGQPHEDAIFGKYQIYTNAVSIPIPLIHPNLNHTVLKVGYQGCSEDGYCYPPTTRWIVVDFETRSAVVKNQWVTENKQTNTAASASTASLTTQTQSFVDTLANQKLVSIVLTFLGFGLLLSFTPCVLPMLPILSGIILGQRQHLTTRKAFLLSLVYVISMSLTYAIAGVLVGVVGGSIQALFQKPWVLVSFSLFFVLLALSFFGLYQIKLPSALENKLAHISGHQQKGRYIGVAIMGCLATLIVSPCVTPALVGVLGYIGKTGDAILGGVALFSLGFGMGVPLLIVGIAGGKFLPKAGKWMRTLENVFGVVFLGIAIWMLDRLFPGPIILALWSFLSIGCAIYLGALSSASAEGWGKLWKACGIFLLVYGILLLVGAAKGSDDPFKPLGVGVASAGTQGLSSSHSDFVRVSTLSDLDAQLTQAKSAHKPVLLDFYADWCVSCQEMQRVTFRDPTVLAALAPFVVIRADITANNESTQALMRQFKVVAPPTLWFRNAQGNWISDVTLVGNVTSQQLLSTLKTI